MNNIQSLLNKYTILDRLDLELIIAEAIKKTRTFIAINQKYKLTCWEFLKFKYFLWLLKHNYPLAYITHHKEFYGLDFWVNKHTLIPRPDTEIMVGEAIEIINNNPQATLVDIGTGSGCVPIAILKNIKKEIPTIAIDISQHTLAIAQKNTATHLAKINFRLGNLFSPIKQKDITTNNLIVTANLPYLTFEQTNNEKSIKKEPYAALYGGHDGLDLYYQLVNQITTFFKDSRPQTIFLLLEIDPAQANKIKQIITEKIPNAEIKIRQDLAGLDRLVIIKF